MGKVPLKAIGTNIVVQLVKADTKSPSGILLSNVTKHDDKIVKVVDIGINVIEVKVGERIVCKEYSATQIKFGADEYLIIDQSDVVAKVVV